MSEHGPSNLFTPGIAVIGKLILECEMRVGGRVCGPSEILGPGK